MSRASRKFFDVFDDNPMIACLQVWVFAMALGIAGLIGAAVGYPNWPTARECSSLCADAGQRVHSFRPHDGGRGLCTCVPARRRCP